MVFLEGSRRDPDRNVNFLNEDAWTRAAPSCGT
jgi:hypothetical protein